MSDLRPNIGEEPGGRLRREGGDVLFLLGCAAAVLLTWLVLFGWDPGREVVVHQDGLTLWVPYFRVLQEGGADSVTSLSWLGGAATRPVVGTPFIFELALRSGLGPVGGVNLSALFTQILLAFLYTSSLLALAPLRARNRWATRVLFVLIGTWLTAFAPVVGWRFRAGHLSILMAMAGYLAGLMLLLRARTGGHTVVGSLAAFAAMVLALTTHGHQVLLYCVVFGAPVVLGLVLLRPGRSVGTGTKLRGYAVAILVLLAAAAAALPRGEEMFLHARSTDATRSLDGNLDAVFSYNRQEMRDWAGAVSWKMDFLVRRGISHLHETNYAFGPLLILAFAWLIRGRRFLGAMLTLCGLLAALFSMGVAPVSSGLVSSIPGLGAFRVPGRAMIPFALCLPLFGGALLLRHGRADTWWSAALLAPAAALAYLLPVTGREVMVFAAAIAFLAAVKSRLRMRPRARALLFPALLGLLVGGSLSAFRERVDPPERFEEGAAVASLLPDPPVGEAALERLERTHLEAEDPQLGLNTEVYLGIPTTEGFGRATRRDAELAAALFGHPYDAMRTDHLFSPDAKGAVPWMALYDFRYRVRVLGEGAEVVPIGHSPGGAWFSEGVREVPDLAALRDALMANEGGLPDYLRRVQLLNREDPLASERFADARSIRAEGSFAGDVEVRAEEGVGVEVGFGRALRAARPLTISLNFQETFRARAEMSDGGERNLTVYPAYHSLAGMVAPAGATKVFLDARAREPRSGSWAGWLSAALFLLAAAVGLPAQRCGPSRDREGSERHGR